MAWILSKAQCLKTGDETHAIFGNIAHQHVKGQITDSQSDHTEDKVTLAIKVKIRIYNFLMLVIYSTISI